MNHRQGKPSVVRYLLTDNERTIFDCRARVNQIDVQAIENSEYTNEWILITVAHRVYPVCVRDILCQRPLPAMAAAETILLDLSEWCIESRWPGAFISVHSF